MPKSKRDRKGKFNGRRRQWLHTHTAIRHCQLSQPTSDHLWWPANVYTLCDSLAKGSRIIHSEKGPPLYKNPPVYTDNFPYGATTVSLIFTKRDISLR